MKLPTSTNRPERPEPGPWRELANQHPALTHTARLIGQHPKLSLAVALSLGVILGCLVKRT